MKDGSGKPERRLTLSRETLRGLGDSALSRAAGGTFYYGGFGGSFSGWSGRISTISERATSIESIVVSWITGKVLDSLIENCLSIVIDTPQCYTNKDSDCCTKPEYSCTCPG